MANERAPVSDTFLTEIRDVQYSLQCEWSMHEVEQTCRERLFPALLSATYFRVFADEKRHFMFMYFLLGLHETNSSRAFTRFRDSFLEVKSIPHHKTPHTFSNSILEHATRTKDTNLIDALTFSALPARFSFFLTEAGVSEFLSFMSTVTDFGIYILYSRAVFVTPGFLQFLQTVFLPIFSSLFTQSAAPTRDVLSATIRERWKTNLHLLPFAVVEFVRACDMAEVVVSGACLEMALTPEGANIFGLLDFNQRLTSASMAVLRDLLTVGGRCSILKDLVGLIQDFDECDMLRLSNIHSDAVPSLFEWILLSNLDFNIDSALKVGDKLILPPEYELGLYSRPTDGAGDEELFRPEPTMAASDRRPEAFLRHLLQAADPIPVFTAPRTNLTLRGFFSDYLQNRGSPESKGFRRAAVQQLFRTVQPFRESTLRSILRKVNFERKKEIRILSLFTEIQEILGKGHAATANSRAHCERVFYYNMLSKLWKDNANMVKNLPFPKLCSQPSSLLQAYKAMTEKLEAIPQLRQNANLAGELAYGFLTRHFDFETFRKLRSNLSALDAKLDRAIEDPSRTIDLLFQPGATAGKKFDMVAWMRGELAKLKERPDLLAFVRNGCVESSPMLKVRFLMDGMTAVRAFLIRNLPPAEEIGADEFTPALICYVVIAKPHAIVSNFAFLGDFCGNRGYKHFESTGSIPLVTLAAVIRDALPGTDLLALTESETVRQLQDT
jgi:hypothetical protein